MLRALVALLLAVATAAAVDHLTARRRARPPGFGHPVRRAAAAAVVAMVLLVGVFTPVVTFDLGLEVDPEGIGTVDLFLFPILLVGGLAAWYLLAHGRLGAAAPQPTPWWECFGLRPGRIGVELGLGVVAGGVAWAAVLAVAVACGAALSLVGGEEWLSGETPQLIVYLAGLPVVLRLAVSLAAGVAEELFFRGFLQPRAGVALTTVVFVCAHLGYGEPLMLVGITVLSLLYSALVRWRGSIWAAICAHTLFDAVQLLVVIPAVLELPEPGPAGLGPALLIHEVLPEGFELG